VERVLARVTDLVNSNLPTAIYLLVEEWVTAQHICVPLESSNGACTIVEYFIHTLILLRIETYTKVVGQQFRRSEVVKSRQTLLTQTLPVCVILGPRQNRCHFVAARDKPHDEHLSTNDLDPNSRENRTYTETQKTHNIKMPTAQSAEFKKAAEDSRKLKAKPTDDELLQVCQHTQSRQKSTVQLTHSTAVRTLQARHARPTVRAGRQAWHL